MPQQIGWTTCIRRASCTHEGGRVERWRSGLGYAFPMRAQYLATGRGAVSRDGPFRRRGMIPTENQRPLASVASPCVLQECAAGRIPFHAAWVQTASAWTFLDEQIDALSTAIEASLAALGADETLPPRRMRRKGPASPLPQSPLPP